MVLHTVAVDVRRLLGNSALMMTLSLITALALGGFPDGLPLTNGNIAMLALMVMMSLSLTNLRLRGLRVQDHSRFIVRAFLLSMVVASGASILISFLFEGDLRSGWILMAALPSAISVIPFTFIMKGDLEPTVVSTAVLYLSALAFTPLLTFLFLGEAVDVMVLITYVAILLLLPMVISRPLRMLDIDPRDRGAMINVALFILFVAIAGPNRDIFFNDWLLSMLLAAAFVRIFGVGLLWDRYLRHRGVERSRRVPEVLFSSHKNTGMAATLAIALLGPAAAVPAIICAVMDIAWLIFLSHWLFRDLPQEGKG
jgi:BASS family bile acid:Na+ symporter